MRLVKRVGVVLFVVFCIAVIAATTFKAFTVTSLIKQGTDIRLPVTVYQMKAENGIIPVELQCGAASVTTPNKLNEFSCTLTNNTVKNIIAANAAYTIIFEQGGRTYRDVKSHLVATFVHPDFYEEAKTVPPG